MATQTEKFKAIKGKEVTITIHGELPLKGILSARRTISGVDYLVIQNGQVIYTLSADCYSCQVDVDTMQVTLTEKVYDRA